MSAPLAQPAAISSIGATAAGALHRREDLAAGAEVSGPAVIGEYPGTTFVPAGWRARRLATADLLLERDDA